MRADLRSLGAFLVLTGTLIATSSLDVVGGGLSPTARDAPAWLLPGAVWVALALAWAATRSRWRGPRLAAALFAVLYGLATALTAVEAVYLEALRPLVVPILLDGAVDAAVASALAAALYGRRGARSDPPPSARLARPAALAWRLPLVGVAYALVFVAAGAGLFLPLARAIAPEALAGYATDLPAWVVPFQAVRGALWAALALPLAASLRDGPPPRGLVLGFAFAAFMGANLLPPNELLPAGLRFAHLAEVALANLAFGGIVTGVLLRRVDRAGRAAGGVRRPRRARRQGPARPAR